MRSAHRRDGLFRLVALRVVPRTGKRFALRHLRRAPDLISERLATLWRISQGEADVVLVPATTALYRLAPLRSWRLHLPLQDEAKAGRSQFKAQLTLAGYSHVSQVVSPGEYAVRGGLIDLFPMGSLVPFRVDLFDDEIDSIRTFDPTASAACTRARGAPAARPRVPHGRRCARQIQQPLARDAGGRPDQKPHLQRHGRGRTATAGIEYYLPLFFDETATVFDYLGNEATVVLHGDLEPAFQRFWQDTKDRFRLVQGDPERPPCRPNRCFSR